jgi:hypothetical protein
MVVFARYFDVVAMSAAVSISLTKSVQLFEAVPQFDQLKVLLLEFMRLRSKGER